jgi:hypothetical protein
MFTSNYHANLVRAVKQNPAYGRFYRAAGRIGAADGDPDTELKKFYTFDELGHIMVATTSKDSDNPGPEVQEAFKKVIVFFGAWTATLSRKGKTLFDYDAVKGIIDKSGYFINTQMEKRSFSSSSTSVSLDTTIIQSVLSGGVTGGGLAIAKRTLAAIGTQINASFEQKQTKKEICHLLFVVESLMNIPIVSLSMFHTTMEQMSWVQKTNCSEVAHSSINFSYSGDDFLFVDPSLIDEFSPEFKSTQAYEDLIAKLESCIA